MQAYIAAAVFDGHELHPAHALLVHAGRVEGIVPVAALPEACVRIGDGSGYLAPGFVDVQVNGGGGVMLNDAPTCDTMRTIATAHSGLGTAAILPTLITDAPHQTRAAIAAAVEACAQGVPGIAGLHLEGPHLSVARKGAHDADYIRAMDDDDLRMLLQAAQDLPSLMLTVAPETVLPAQIAQLVAAGVTVSLGHSDASYGCCLRAVQAGATCVTHLFNAMSQLGNREPGLVGAALDQGLLHAGVIADGVHVHPVSLAAAVRAKRGPGEVFLVTDAMAPAGTDMRSFTLNGREIQRHDGQLRLADGTLAGADLNMATALAVMVHQVGVPLRRALRMATSAPAEAIGRADLGRLQVGRAADFVLLSSDLALRGFWREGRAFCH